MILRIVLGIPPILPRLIIMEDMRELIQPRAVQKAQGAYHTGNRAGRESTTGKSNDDDFITGVIVVADEAVRFDNGLRDADTEDSTEVLGDLGGFGADL